MNYHQKYRKKWSHVEFETRALPEINGVTPLISMPLWYWKNLDNHVKSSAATVTSITEFCLEHAQMKRKEENCGFSEIFYEGFLYYIYNGYCRRLQDEKGIANRFW
ncbi:hypothetical protein [Aliikangiella maris]|uniref:Uncharacterized protein n=2 Tax=Aliikangiella maris TaxID=3162458 RepID=A0ABV2BTJ2_9GAMM